MMFRALPAVVLALLLATCAACSNQVKVTGKVTFADGTPLTMGTVYFTDSFHLGRSDLDKNGEYSLHCYRRNDGVPKGIYQAYITGAIVFNQGESRETEFGALDLQKVGYLIDMQYMIPDTSGWLFDVQKDCRIDLVVYPPGQVPEEERNEKAKYFFDPEYRKKVDKEKGKEPPKKPRLVNPSLL